MSILADKFGPLDLATLRYGAIIEESAGLSMYLGRSRDPARPVIIVRLTTNPAYKYVPGVVQTTGNLWWRVVKA